MGRRYLVTEAKSARICDGSFRKRLEYSIQRRVHHSFQPFRSISISIPFTIQPFSSIVVYVSFEAPSQDGCLTNGGWESGRVGRGRWWRWWCEKMISMESIWNYVCLNGNIIPSAAFEILLEYCTTTHWRWQHRRRHLIRRQHTDNKHIIAFAWIFVFAIPTIALPYRKSHWQYPIKGALCRTKEENII